MRQNQSAECCVFQLKSFKIFNICDLCEESIDISVLEENRIFRKPVHLFDAVQRISLIKINKYEILFYKYYNKYNARVLILTDRTIRNV
jgi:hypothetical protein